MTIEWKEPPTAARRKWKAVIAEIHSRPGQWAFVGEMNVSTAYVYARRFGLELEIANRTDGRGDVYLRASEVN